MQILKPFENRDTDKRDRGLEFSLMELTQIIMQGLLPSEKRIGSLLDRIEGTP